MENFNPAVSPAFNTGCMTGATVLSGSCTAASNYWLSTTYANFPILAWFVDFFDGIVNAFGKDSFLHVRAVRGGS